MSRHFLTTFLLLSVTFLDAQNYQIIDSLKRRVATPKEDTGKVNTYAELGWQYQWSYPDSALSYTKLGLTLARKLHFKKGELAILFPMSEALSMKGEYSGALQLRFQALELAKKLNDSAEIAMAYAFIGALYFDSGLDYQKALYYYRKSIASNKTLVPTAKVMYGFLGETYFHLNQLDSAFFYIKKAYDLDVKESRHWTVPYFYLAAIYEKLNEPAKAINLYRTGLNNGINKLDMINGYNGMASAFKKMGQIDSSIFYSKNAIAEGLNTSLSATVIDAAKLLTDLYKANQNVDSAFKYQNIMIVAMDSLFNKEKVKQMQNIAFEEQLRQQEIEAAKKQYINRVKLYGLIAALTFFITIVILLWRNNRHKQKAFDLLEKQKLETDRQREKAEYALEELKSTQSQLVQREKMASLGELTAGIAHEIQNPLNFVNNFSEVNKELIEELEQANDKGNQAEVKVIAADLKDNEQKIAYHGKRADAIVKGMLQHSRANTGKKDPTDINALADEYLRLAFHGMRAKDKTFNAILETHFDESIGKIEVIPQDIGRVLLNLFNNAFYAVTEKKKQSGEGYEPTVSVSTRKLDEKIEIRVKDNGIGIPEKAVEKIFQPFFTTKPTGQGTGLGLSLSYDIIKAHNGEIRVETKGGEGAEFIIQLPTKENL